MSQDKNKKRKTREDGRQKDKSAPDHSHGAETQTLRSRTTAGLTRNERKHTCFKPKGRASLLGRSRSLPGASRYFFGPPGAPSAAFAFFSRIYRAHIPVKFRI